MQVFLLLSFISSLGNTRAAASPDYPLDGLYRQAQRTLQRGDFTKALPMLENYLERAKETRHKRSRLLAVIDEIGSIHLRVRRNPNAAIAFFERIAKDQELEEAELDVIDGWIGGARDWRDNGEKTPKSASADNLFRNAQAYYKKGLKNTQRAGIDAGHAYFHIAASYLIPFLVHHDADRRIGEALLMMGDIRRQTWTDSDYWSDNYYLREAIRRNPHTSLAAKAFTYLRADVVAGYTGSSGTNLPPSVQAMLRRFERLSKTSETKSTATGKKSG